MRRILTCRIHFVQMNTYNYKQLLAYLDSINLKSPMFVKIKFVGDLFPCFEFLIDYVRAHVEIVLQYSC